MNLNFLYILAVLCVDLEAASRDENCAQIFEGSKTFSVEPKYDGERILAHVDVEAAVGSGEDFKSMPWLKVGFF